MVGTGVHYIPTLQYNHAVLNINMWCALSQDVYINRAKVREFQFQINNLFGCSGKPFSCDVEIRHADQLTVLPIEIEV